MTRLSPEVSDRILATILASGNDFDAVATKITADGVLLILHSKENPGDGIAAGTFLDWRAAYYVATRLFLSAMETAPSMEAIEQYRAELRERIMEGAL